MDGVTNKQIVIVVGAGASLEFAPKQVFPIGAELASQISIALSSALHEITSPRPQTPAGRRPPRSRLAQALISEPKLRREMEAAAGKVADTIVGHASIDDLLNEWTDRPAMARVSKLAIADIIAEAESRSYLAAIRDRTSAQAAMSRVKGTWLGTLLAHLHPNTPRRRLPEALKNVAFIIFNYDRLVEKSLYHWIQAVTDLPPQEAAEAVERITIIHPHGSLGPLNHNRWHDEFGSITDLVACSEAIRTYSDGVRDLNEVAGVQKLVLNASTLVFLGFSYHPSNLALLIPEGSQPAGEIFGTTFALSDARKRVAGERILGPKWSMQGSMRFRAEMCSPFMQSLVPNFSHPQARAHEQ